MTVQELNNAMELIDDKFLELALNYKNEANSSKSRRITLRRVIFLAAAILTLLIGSTAAACELNEDFKQAVLTFFNIQVSDKVERTPAENEPLSDNVTVTRILVPDNGHWTNGMFAICSDEIEYRSGSRYDIYKYNHNRLEKLESHIYSETLTHNGKSYSVYLEWSTDGKNIACNQIKIDWDVNANVMPISGSNREVFAVLDAYPIIIDLETHQITPLCPHFQYSGSMSYSNYCTLTDDRRAVLYIFDKCFCDLTTGEMFSLEELCGAKLDKISYLGNGMVAGWNYDRGTNVWRFDMNTKAVTQVITGAGCIVHQGGKHLIQALNSGEMRAISMIDGSIQTLDGLVWPENTNKFTVLRDSDNGDKLIMVSRSETDMSMNRIDVIDFQANRIITIDRVPPISYNEDFVSFDGGTITVRDEVLDENNQYTGSRWYYIYTVDFRYDKQ